MEIIPEKDLMVDLLDKGFKTTVLKMLKELKEGMDKVKKMMHEQNVNSNKKVENLKKKPERNSGTEKYSNWNKKFTSGIKGRFEQAEERISELEYRTMEIIKSEEQK